ncbi:MAG: hypothetical protein H2057_01295 [Alphaproteobacteria bacterium]|nr:hypothetical protein [Alphaproteobacteria bacterium]
MRFWERWKKACTRASQKEEKSYTVRLKDTVQGELSLFALRDLESGGRTLCQWQCRVDIPGFAEGRTSEVSLILDLETRSWQELKKVKSVQAKSGYLNVYDDGREEYEVESATVALSFKKGTRFVAEITLEFPEGVPLDRDYRRQFLTLKFSAGLSFEGIQTSEGVLAVLPSEFRQAPWLYERVSRLVDLAEFEGPFYPYPWPEPYERGVSAWFKLRE